MNPVTKGKKIATQASLINDFIESGNNQTNTNVDKHIDGNKSILNELESNNDEMAKIYDNIQKNKELKLKEYRNMVLKMKKDKRDNDLLEQEEEMPKKEDPIEDRIAKKRQEMRKSLAESLKNKK